MLVDLRGRYAVESNRESGFGRYDVALVPLSQTDPALIIEFKVFDPRREETLADNFSYTLLYGLDGRDYKTPEIIEAIDAYLKGER